MEKGNYQKKSSDRIYVTGHINPDTDSIASAIGYAWLLNERDGEPTVASRAGAINMQTLFVLKTSRDRAAIAPDRCQSSI